MYPDNDYEAVNNSAFLAAVNQFLTEKDLEEVTEKQWNEICCLTFAHEKVAAIKALRGASTKEEIIRNHIQHGIRRECEFADFAEAYGQTKTRSLDLKNAVMVIELLMKQPNFFG